MCYLVHPILEEAFAGGDPVGGMQDAVVHREPRHKQHRHHLVIQIRTSVTQKSSQYLVTFYGRNG
jgi:hypothetical protein